ncbi:MAG TPA: hypothetical protein VN516_02445 [Candidatus Baltobacteraceae bacterium]|nr:hypothetical protein [Candidatus Baltobacteraceae bacterium]
MKNALIIFALCFATIVGATDLAKSSVFQIRLVIDESSANSEKMKEQLKAVDSGKIAYSIVEVQKAVLLDQAALESVSVSTNYQGNPAINCRFTSEGKKRFAEITDENIGKRIAVIIDGKLITAPKVAGPITAGDLEVTGNFSEREAKDLTAKINAAIAK